MSDLVLLTGISGFIAKHVAMELLGAGYRVRGTLRSPSREAEVRAALASAGCDVSRLDVVAANLTSDEGWRRAAEGCRFVLHTASPFPAGLVRDRAALLPAAREGTVRVIQAAAEAGVERVVVTSSVAAVQYGHPGRGNGPFGEADFSDATSRDITPYAISKTLAEQAAWETARDLGVDLATVNPGVVLGPLLDARYGTSASIVAMMMKGRMPLVPGVAFAIVDVRDVAKAHLAAMTHPEAGGRRFLLSAGSRSLAEIGMTLAGAFPAYRRRMPRGVLPDILVRLAARVHGPLQQILPELGMSRQIDSGPAQAILGLSLATPETAIVATAESLLAHRLG